MFLTLEDPRARIKGSRDPLGVQPVWAAFGRHVVTNLTTVTRSVRGFSVLLLGRYLADRLRSEGRVDDDGILDLFLRCEQIGAYARHVVHGGQGILGIEQVTRNAHEGGGKVWIETSARGRILSDQKTYGLWGLYTVSARVSGLLDAENRPTEATIRHVEEVAIPPLRPVWKKATQLLLKGARLGTRKNDRVLAAFGQFLGNDFSEVERTFYASYLRDGIHVDETGVTGRQALFRDLLERHGDLEQACGREELERLLSAASTEDEGLATRLERILWLEAFLAPAEALFGHLQARHGQARQELAKSVRTRWGGGVPHLKPSNFEALRGEVETQVGSELTAAMALTYAALASGDYEATIEALCDWNRVVVARRHAAPWVRIDDRGRLDVRYRGAEAELPEGDALATLWRNPYFIDSLKTIALELREGNV